MRSLLMSTSGWELIKYISVVTFKEYDWDMLDGEFKINIDELIREKVNLSTSLTMCNKLIKDRQNVFVMWVNVN